MQKFQGKGVYAAVAIGKVSVFKRNAAEVRRVNVDDAAKEIERFEAAKALAVEQLTAIHEKALNEVGTANAEIFEIHIMMLDDEDYNESIKSRISTPSTPFP